MTQLEQQMQAELLVTQTFADFLADYLTQKGVPSTSDEGLDTLVPKVLLISSVPSVEPVDEIIDCLLYESANPSTEGAYFIAWLENRREGGEAGGTYLEKVPSTAIVYIYDAEIYLWNGTAFSHKTTATPNVQVEYLPPTNINRNSNCPGEINGTLEDNVQVGNYGLHNVVRFDFKDASGRKYVIPLLRSELASFPHRKLVFNPYFVNGVDALNLADEHKDRIVMLRCYFVVVDNYSDEYSLDDVLQIDTPLMEGADYSYFPRIGEVAHRWLPVILHFPVSNLGYYNAYIEGYENYRRTTTISNESTDWQMPTAKAVNDFVNGRMFKIEDTSVSAWVASTKYADFAYEAQINIADLR